MSAIIRKMSQNDIPLITRDFKNFDYPRSEDMFTYYWFEHQEGSRVVWFAYDTKHNVFVGYVTLVWLSKYQPFFSAGIPEIKDLNVVPSYRKQGIASRLLEAAETTALERSSVIGIAVGMPSDYGAAQRLYIKRGYIPDGKGITNYEQPLQYGQCVIIDNLTLWLTKTRD